MKTACHYTPLLALFLMLVIMTAREVQSNPRLRAESTTPFVDGRPAGACCDIGKAQCSKGFGCFECGGGKPTCQVGPGSPCVKSCSRYLASVSTFVIYFQASLQVKRQSLIGEGHTARASKGMLF